jgi:signal transduction histidine kinase
MVALELDSGVSLLKQNEYADAVYFLKQGAVKVLVNGEMVAQIDKAQCFGEMSCLLPSTPASASVITAKKSQLVRISKDDFLASVNQVGKLWKTLFLQMSERVRSVNSRLSEILNHLPQGLVKISSEGLVSNDYSVQCTKFFQRDNMAGCLFHELAFPDDEKKQKTWAENLSLLFSESNMSFEACASLLQSEFSLGEGAEKREFTMTYSPCRNLQGKIVAVDIGIVDVTIEKQLERKNQEIRQRQDRLTKITQNPESYINFLALADEVYLDAENFARQVKDKGSASVQTRIAQLMRQLHSLKGISGVYSLGALKSVVHEIESLVGQFNGTADDRPEVLLLLEKKLGEFKSEKERAQEMFNEIPSDLRRRLIGVVFSQFEFESLKELSSKGDFGGIEKLLVSIETVDAKRLIGQWPQEAEQIATTLGKSVQFNVAGEGGRVSKALFTELDKVLIHLLRNGIDHGVEMPDDRLKAGKPAQGRITAMIDVSDTEFFMSVEDDGRGIHPAALAERARQKDSLDQALVAKYVAQGEEWKILLMPGFSTATEVTDLSGRGVGLDAVANLVERLGGSLVIESSFGEGTCFIITIPI